MIPTTFEAAAKRVADAIWAEHRYGGYKTALEAIDDNLDDGDFVKLGDTALSELFCFFAPDRGYRETLDDVVDLVCRKQHDYGHSNIARYGVEGIKVRMSDKICRLRNLESRGDAALNESIEDCWVDLVGYSIVGAMFENGTFFLPLAEDMANAYAEAIAADDGIEPEDAVQWNPTPSECANGRLLPRR